jgi:hypothetical protein
MFFNDYEITNIYLRTLFNLTGIFKQILESNQKTFSQVI